MNDYLTPLTDEVLAHRGTVDKYMGDAIMAFWNAPLDNPRHAADACDAALAMIEALKAFNAARAAKMDPARFKPARFGIGIATGDCSVGNLGSVRRFDYSAIGDPVNLASRIRGITKVLTACSCCWRTTRCSSPAPMRRCWWTRCASRAAPA